VEVLCNFNWKDYKHRKDLQLLQWHAAMKRKGMQERVKRSVESCVRQKEAAPCVPRRFSSRAPASEEIYKEEASPLTVQDAWLHLGE